MNQSLYGNIIFLAGVGGNHLRWLLFLDDKFPNMFESNKLDFIKTQVYNTNRTWNNWLLYEWKFRDKLNSILQLSHDTAKSYQSIKELYLFTDINTYIAINHYYSINLGLNGQSLPDFSQNFVIETNKIKNIVINNPTNQKIVSGDFLHEPVLCKNSYRDIINFYNFNDNYDLAFKVHQLYYQCRTKSLQDFYVYFNSNEWKTRFDIIRKQINVDS